MHKSQRLREISEVKMKTNFSLSLFDQLRPDTQAKLLLPPAPEDGSASLLLARRGDLVIRSEERGQEDLGQSMIVVLRRRSRRG